MITVAGLPTTTRLAPNRAEQDDFQSGEEQRVHEKAFAGELADALAGAPAISNIPYVCGTACRPRRERQARDIDAANRDVSQKSRVRHATIENTSFGV